jgi:AmiR/NasT family two-component response regulator
MLTEAQAFERLRAVSQHENRKLRDVADDVVLMGSLEPGKEDDRHPDASP